MCEAAVIKNKEARIKNKEKRSEKQEAREKDLMLARIKILEKRSVLRVFLGTLFFTFLL